MYGGSGKPCECKGGRKEDWKRNPMPWTAKTLVIMSLGG